MKFMIGLAFALTATIVWQTSVLSQEEPNAEDNKNIQQINQENQAAGRVPFDQADCD